MSTDIKAHFDLLKEFELKFGSRSVTSGGAVINNNSNNCIGLNGNSETPAASTVFTDIDLQLLSSMIIHAADFHGSSQTFDLSKKWSLLVNQEFQAQVTTWERMSDG